MKRFALIALSICLIANQGIALAQANPAKPAPPAPPKPAPDVIIFTNGDQLTGQLERGIGNSITFKSDVAGEITVSLDKVKELHANGSFVVLSKETPPSRRVVVKPGTLVYGDGSMTVTKADEPPKQIAEKDLTYVIDPKTYAEDVGRRPGLWYGWSGNITAGATLVRSTQDGSSFTGGATLIRTVPLAGFLPKRNRTTIDVTETYGKLTQPTIPQTTPPTPVAIAKTSIFHADAERDEYFSPRFFALGATSFDHNFSQGLNLQQIYGGGVGWIAITNPKQELDLKADVHYENQQFQTSSSNLDLIGSTLSETYKRNLPHKMLLTVATNFLPAWNDFHAFSANGSVIYAMPVFKRFSLTVTTSDSFLNNPSVGYEKNSFQFVTGVSYSLR